MPPTLAGDTRLTNDEANCTDKIGVNGMCSGTVPIMPNALDEVREERHEDDDRNPSPMRRLERLEAVSDLGELRQDEVERTRGERDHDATSAPALDGSAPARSGTPPPAAAAAARVAARTLSPRATARRVARREGERLQQGNRRRDRRRADPGQSAVDGSLRADSGRQRGEQLGDVEIDGALAGGELGEAEIDDPRSSLAVDHHVCRSQRPMGDADRHEDGRLRATAAAAVRPSTARPTDRRATIPSTKSMTNIAESSGPLTIALDVRRAHAGALGHQPDQRLMLDRLLQRRGRAHVTDIAQTNGPVGAVEQVGVALILAEDLDEESLTCGVRDDEWARSLSVHRGELRRHDREASGLQRRGDVVGPGRRSGAPNATSRPVPTVTPTAKASTNSIGRTVPEINRAAATIARAIHVARFHDVLNHRVTITATATAPASTSGLGNAALANHPPRARLAASAAGCSRSKSTPMPFDHERGHSAAQRQAAQQAIAAPAQHGEQHPDDHDDHHELNEAHQQPPGRRARSDALGRWWHRGRAGRSLVMAVTIDSREQQDDAADQADRVAWVSIARTRLHRPSSRTGSLRHADSGEPADVSFRRRRPCCSRAISKAAGHTNAKPVPMHAPATVSVSQ